jgi:hypothetical protein
MGDRSRSGSRVNITSQAAGDILWLPASNRARIGFDYEKHRMIKDVKLLPSHSHPATQPVLGPAGRVPPEWEALLH